MSVAPGSTIDLWTGTERPLAVATVPSDAATSSTTNGGSAGTASSNVPSSGKHESASYMPVRLPIVASGSASNEMRRGSRRVVLVVDGTFEPFLGSLTLPPPRRNGNRYLESAIQTTEDTRWQLT